MTVRSRTWLKNNFLERDPDDYNRDLIDSFGIGVLSVTGTVYYVDPVSGSDTTNNGQSPDEAFATLQHAIDQCVDDRGDVIIRMQGTENPTTAILFNKAGITVIADTYGQNPWQPEKYSTYPDASYTTGPMGIISAPCAIIGLEFVTRNTSGGTYPDDPTDSGAALVFSGHAGGDAGGFSLIKHCRFVDWWGNPWGIEFAAGAYNRIEQCVFEGFNAGAYFRITSARNPDHNHIVECHFVDCTNGIEHRTGVTPHNFLYKENTFIDYTDAIDFNNQAADGLVASNWYETATDAATYDITVAAAQVLGINFSGNHYSE